MALRGILGNSVKTYKAVIKLNIVHEVIEFLHNRYEVFLMYILTHSTI